MSSSDSDDVKERDHAASRGTRRWVLAVLVAHAVVLTTYGIVLAIATTRSVPGPPATPAPAASSPDQIADLHARLDNSALRSEQLAASLDEYDVAIQNLQGAIRGTHEQLSAVQSQLAELEEFWLVRVENDSDAILESVQLRFPGLTVEFNHLLDGDLTRFRAIHTDAAGGPIEVEVRTPRKVQQLGSLILLREDLLGPRFRVVISRQDGKLAARVADDE